MMHFTASVCLRNLTLPDCISLTITPAITPIMVITVPVMVMSDAFVGRQPPISNGSCLRH
jgi:hypothetical protein